MRDYDSWLVAPMEAREAEGERFIDFCETHGISPDDPESEGMYEDWLDEWREVEYDYDEPVDDFYPDW